MPLDFERIRSDLESMKAYEALPALRDAENTNDRWVREVARPLIQRRGRLQVIELRGKALVDRFRADAAELYANLTRRTALANARISAGLLLVGFCAAAALGVIFIASIVFAVQQYRLGIRLEQERAKAERERRKLAEARAAYATEKRLADTLQEALSQQTFPELPTARFSGTYVPASEEAQIGGDWYDALQLSDGRVLVGIGDVTGHGIDAVVAMNRARQLLIGAALLDANPAAVLGRVNAELLRMKAQIITACAGLIATATREFTYAAAGHPPPVLCEPGRPAKLLAFGSLALGVADATRYQAHTIRMAPGAMIVLYTDGLIEHSRDIAAGEAALLEAVEFAAASTNADAADLIRERIFAQRSVADDVAILTIRLLDGSPAASA